MSELLTIKGRCGEAVRNNDERSVRQCFLECPVLHTDITFLKLMMRAAVVKDNLEMVKLLVELGASINAPVSEDGDEGLIYEAAIWSAVRVTRWLLEQGVRLNYEWERTTRCLSLSMAAMEGNLEIAKLLVEHGADINSTWAGSNALSVAIEYGHTEIASHLRSQGAKSPEELGLVTVADFPSGNAFVAHVSAFLGTPDKLALREIVPTDLPIAIHVIRTEAEQILVTEGMSARPMTVPEGGEAFQYAELVLRLPSDWPLTLEAFENPQHYWPIEWLKRIARYPHDNDTWMGGPHTIIANDEPPEPFAPNTNMSCLMLLANPSEFGRWTRPTDGAEVAFYDVFGLYTEERDLELREGIAALLNRFQDRRISNILDPQRPHVSL